MNIPGTSLVRSMSRIDLSTDNRKAANIIERCKTVSHLGHEAAFHHFTLPPNQCSICLENVHIFHDGVEYVNVHPEKITMLEPVHAFHKSCLNVWVERNRRDYPHIRCPICREFIDITILEMALNQPLTPRAQHPARELIHTRIELDRPSPRSALDRLVEAMRPIDFGSMSRSKLLYGLILLLGWLGSAFNAAAEGGIDTLHENNHESLTDISYAILGMTVVQFLVHLVEMVQSTFEDWR